MCAMNVDEEPGVEPGTLPLREVPPLLRCCGGPLLLACTASQAKFCRSFLLSCVR